MQFDELSVVVLTTKTPAPARSDAEDDAIQDAHMAHLADLHEKGHMLAAGPMSDAQYRGMLLLRTDVATARELMNADPGVVEGWFDVAAMAWRVPRGAMHFTSTTFPRSMADTL